MVGCGISRSSGRILALLLLSCVTLAEFCDVAQPQFHHLSNGGRRGASHRVTGTDMSAIYCDNVCQALSRGAPSLSRNCPIRVTTIMILLFSFPSSLGF